MRQYAPALIIVLVSLAGCNGGTVNRGVESVHQPIVQRTDYIIDLATSGSVLAPGERDRLDGWLRSIQLGFGDHVTVDDTAAPGAGAREIAALVGQRGMLMDGAAPVTPGSVQAGSVRVIVSRARASVPNCPDWSRRSHPEFVGSAMSNYGCASNSALAAMVANPEDLVHGRSGDGISDAVTSRKAIDTFRRAEPTGKSGVTRESSRGK